jgi:hypothetical protein
MFAPARRHAVHRAHDRLLERDDAADQRVGLGDEVATSDRASVGRHDLGEVLPAKARPRRSTSARTSASLASRSSSVWSSPPSRG